MLHTGDFRSHGFRGKGLFSTLARYVGDVDVLICEGTTIDRGSIGSMSEYELSQNAKKILQDNKYSFIACASTNFDRIAAICSAVPRGKYCLCDGYQKSLIDVVTKHSGSFSRLYQFPKMLTYSDNLLDKMEKYGFCFFVRLGNYLSDYLLDRFKDKDPLIVYSMWSGYLDEEKIKNAVAGYRIETLHTSGHADVQTIDKLIKTVNPRFILPIHTNDPSSFPNNTATILNADDGQEISII